MRVIEKTASLWSNCIDLLSRRVLARLEQRAAAAAAAKLSEKWQRRNEKLITALSASKKQTAALNKRVRQQEAQIQSLIGSARGQADQIRDLAWKLGLLELTLARNERDQAILSEAVDRLTATSVKAHIARRIDAAELLTDPSPHVIVTEVFPEEIYELIIRSIPPVQFFTQNDPIKQNFRPHSKKAPTLSKLVWGAFDKTICGEVILPSLVRKFEKFQDRHYEEILGREFVARARALPQVTSKGRLMCRRPGYHLRPHLDPKSVYLTALFYFPRSQDKDESYGTQVWRCDRPFEAQHVHTYYPETDGIECELVKTVPYRRNTLLVFMNSRAAHGVEIPEDAAPSLERYSYQVYVRPQEEAMNDLIDDLPPNRQAAWRRTDQNRTGRKKQLKRTA